MGALRAAGRVLVVADEREIAALLAEGAEHTRELPIPPWGFGAAALVIFVTLLFIVTRFDPDR